MTTVKKLQTATIAALFALGLSACGGGAGPGQVANGSSTPEGRPTGMDNNAVATTIKAATPAHKVEIKNGTVRAFFKEGSKSGAAAGIYCSALDVVTAKDEKRFLVYPDGELDCAKRYENN